MTAFPVISETFILREIESVEGQGVGVVPVSLRHPWKRVGHEDAERYARRTLYPSFNLARAALVNLRFLFSSPRRYLYAAAYILTGHPKSWFCIRRGRSAAWKTLLLFPFLVELATRLSALSVRHCHATSVAISGTATIILTRLLGGTYSMTGRHSDLWSYPPDDLQRRITQALFFTTVSEDNRARILARLPSLHPSAVRLVREGVRLDRFHPPEKSRAGAPGRVEVPILVTVARLVPAKGHDVIVAAARLLAHEGIGFRWLIVGDGPLRSALGRAARTPPLDGRLCLLGPMTQQDIQVLLRAATLFVLASRSEGLPVALIEALASGLPCVATRVSGIPEIVRDGVNGLLVPADNPSSLAEAIVRLLSDPGWRDRVALAARSSVERDRDVRLQGHAMATLLPWGGSMARHAMKNPPTASSSSVISE